MLSAPPAYVRRARKRAGATWERELSVDLIGVAEHLLYARPADLDEALAALEWMAGRQGKTVAQLIEETGDSSGIRAGDER